MAGLLWILEAYTGVYSIADKDESCYEEGINRKATYREWYVARIFAIASGERFLPRLAAAVFATASGERFLPRLAALIFALVSGERGRPIWFAVIFALCSGVRCLPLRSAFN